MALDLTELDTWRAEAEDFRKAEETERLRRRQIERGDAHDWQAWYVALDQRIGAAIDRWFEINPLQDALDQALADEKSDRHEQITTAIDNAKRPLEAKLTALEQRLWETGERCDDRIEAAQARLRSSLIEAVAAQMAEVCEELRKEFRQTIAAMQSALEEQFAAAVEKALPNKLPTARAWEPDRVFYRGDVVVHRGATFQATCDTAYEPPHAGHWVCLARAGNDALTFTLRGPLDAKARYRKFDIVEFDGNSYVARRDNPGVPGHDDGWQLLAGRGNRGIAGLAGPRGLRGSRGPQADPPPTITAWKIDREHYRAVPMMSDSTFGPPLELHALFDTYHSQTSE